MPQQNTAKFILRLLDSFKKNEDKIAVVDQNGQRQTTYKELFTMACRVAGYLQQKNYHPHSFIGICLPTSMEYVAAELGIWLSRNVIVPMGDSYPQDRIDYIMGHCEASLLINSETFKAIAQESPIEINSLPDEDDILALYYTSGSTGNPKGVIHTYSSFDFSQFTLNTLRSVTPLVMGMTLSMFYVVSEYMLASLCVGGKVVVVPPSVIKDIRQLESFYMQHHITFAFFTPSLLRFFRNQSSDLQLVIVTSERLSGIGPGNYKMINFYGQTETGEACFKFDIDKAYENTPIGKPLQDHFEYRILNDDLQEVAQGEEGELCLRGRLSPGYYKDAKRTEELWRGGWLHTGDIVRELPDGNIVYVNRKDWMVKINGQRVEPGEVEAVMKQVDGVENAIVKGFTTNDRQFLCAYYIANENVSEDTIRDYLLSKLPAYMVPVYFVKMESFPLLPNGKTDRKSLLAPTVQAEGIIRPPYAAPTNSIERQLCDAFEKALSADQVGIDDDFFELGGDSIRVMQVQTLCPELPLSARMIYANRTPARIAEACKHSEVISFKRQEDYPLSQTQLGIFVECMSRQGEVAYNNGMLFQLNPTVDAEQLAKACETVVEAHPYIKTRLFVDSQGDPRQLRNDAEPYHQNVESLTQQEFEKLKSKLIRPFDLLNDRLFRIRILKTPEAQYLFMDFHHIIFDGMSFNIFLQDLKDAYGLLPIKREEFTGYEVALEEESLRKTDAYTSALNWYKEQFGALKVSSLPIPEKQESQITFGQEHLELSVDYHQLEEACNRLDVTPNVLTTTVFGYLLGVNTHAHESLFATIFSGRQDLKTQRTMAMLVKTLPVYTQWNQKTTVRELLQTTKQQLMGSMSNSLFSFAEVKAMNHAINSHILFAYQGDLKPSDSELFTYQPLMENATGEDLAFEILLNDTKLILHTEYHRNQYTQSFIQRLMHGYNTVLEGFLNTTPKDKLLCELPILTDDEQQAIIALGTGEHLDYDRSETVVDLFHRQATLTPDNVAVVDEVSEITYAELDRRSDVLAVALRKAGVSTDTFVAIMLPRRKEFLIAVFAVFKAGGAYVPLDSDYPKDRLAYILEDSEAPVLITTSTLSKDCQTEQYFPQEKQLLIDDFDFNEPSAHPFNFAQPSALAYMIYTSGTTGMPKGVMIEHQSLHAHLGWHNDLLNITPEDHCAQHPSFSFDASLDDLLPPLVQGAQLHILSSDLRHNMQEMNDYFNKHSIVGLAMSCQLGTEMLKYYQLPLRYLMLGGSKMHHVPTGNTSVINCYGPTEFTVCSSYYKLEQDEKHDNIPIGRPVPNSISVVVDTEGRLVPQGTVGELCLIGCQMSRGYWKQEALTKERFVDCSFLNGQKMYRTGDLVRWNEEGLLEYIGRIDNQVKLHGYRIELEEIENKMTHCPGVVSAAAIVHKQDHLEYIIGYYTSEGNQELSHIHETLMAELPSYMVPRQLIRIEQMPLTPNGKIDYQALPAPVLSTETRVAPETEMEEQVLELIAEQLKTTQIGVTDNLLHWGLSSLAAMRLSALLQRRFGVYIKMVEIMKHPRVRAIASLLSKVSDSTLPIYERRASYPLMENQRGLYLEWKKNPDTTQYNIPFVYGFEGIDTDRMVDALKQVVNAHPYLKSKLMEVNGEVVLQRHDEDTVEVKVTERCEEPDDAYFQKRVLPFHLLGDQLYRIEVLKTPHKTYLFFDIHHIIFDGLSRKVLLKDLKQAYEGKILKKESYQAYDFALYEQEELRNTEKTQKAESWYDELLAGANAISLRSYSIPDGVGYAEVEVSVPRHQIETFCAVNGITVNSFMHAAFAVFVKHNIRGDHPLYLTISNGRDAGASLQQCIGMFVKTLPIVITSKLVQGQSTADFVKEIHEQLQKSYSMDYYPYTQIVARHRVNAELMFLYQDEVGKNNSWENMAQIPLSLDTVKFPISIIITPETDSYRVTLEYDGKRYNSQGIRLMSQAFRNVLINMAVAATVCEVELISPEEKSELLKLSRGKTIEYDSSETIIDLFHRQAILRPDNIAVVDEASEITYAELDHRSDLLATALRKAGVCTDTFVAIMLPRRKEFLISVFAVFKAGGAYIPLDSEYPKDRLAFMLKDSDAQILITTSTILKDCHTEQYFPREKQLLIDDFDFNGSSDHPINFAQPSGLAYMIYTSGTTGMPKGVMIEHKNLRAFLQFRIDLLHLTQEDRCAQHASFSFDASLDDLLPPLIKGAQVHILSSELRQDIKGMNDYFKRYKITGLTMSTQLGVEMLSHFSLPLRYLMLGGSKMPRVSTGNTQVINGYGPTEFTVCSSYYKLEQDEKHQNIPIGRPVPNSFSVVVDNEGSLVPQGVIGELCLIGHQMSRGYWKQEALTKERFVDCSFLKGQKMYRTGDLVRWNEEGLLEYIGRIDNQVKIHGYRIELEEIEIMISQCPGVISTSVIVHKQGNVEFLVAYYTSEGNKELPDIQKTLMAELPSYMVPSYFIKIEQMPKTPNGKIDRHLLEEHFCSLSVDTDTVVKPSNEKEQVLLDLTKTLLGIDNIGVTDDLTLLGLSSLDAIRLADQAYRNGLIIKVNDILRSKSIRAILINEQSVGKCENGYDATRPVIVIVQGFTYYKKLEPLISKLCKHYSVFVIEPFDDHYKALFSEDNLSFNDIVDFYLDFMEASLRPNINIEMFVGHSFGGELAYHCAVRWRERTDTIPKVCMFDTFTHVANIAQELPVPKIENPTPDEVSGIEELKEWNRHLRQMQALKDDPNLPAYDGDVLYFKAEDLAMQNKIIQINVQALGQKKQEELKRWSTLAPRMSIYPVVANHFTMLDEQFCNNYIEKINDICLTPNS